MNKLIRNIFTLILLLCAVLPAFAQGGRPPAYRDKNNKMHRPNAGKRFEAVKRGYMAQQLALTAEQGDRFWPLYDQYQSELNTVLRLRRANNTSAQPGGDQFDKDLSYQQKIISIQKHYHDEFLKVLPPEKVTQLYKSESDFKFELLRRLKEGREPAEN